MFLMFPLNAIMLQNYSFFTFYYKKPGEHYNFTFFPGAVRCKSFFLQQQYRNYRVYNSDL